MPHPGIHLSQGYIPTGYELSLPHSKREHQRRLLKRLAYSRRSSRHNATTSKKPLASTSSSGHVRTSIEFVGFYPDFTGSSTSRSARLARSTRSSSYPQRLPVHREIVILRSFFADIFQERRTWVRRDIRSTVHQTVRSASSTAA